MTRASRLPSMLGRSWLTLAALAFAAPALRAQEPAPAVDAPPPPAFDAGAAITKGVAFLVAEQESERKDHWPYEGVYRVDGQIPIGYEVGGTAIVSLALIHAPGYAEDEQRQEAVRRGVAFILEALGDERMQAGFIGNYDVRAWGHIYALLLFLQLDDLDVVPVRLKNRVKVATRWLVRTVQEMAIPESGGWNYSLRRGFGKPGNEASPFMTGPALQALFHARARKFEVSDRVVNQALDALERGRTASGGQTYSAPGKAAAEKTEEDLPFMHKLPGAIARMSVVEVTLLLAGRGSPDRVHHAVTSFFEHWEALEVRRQKGGTHLEPYGVAPYYFMYGHYYVAQAIEALPDEAEKQTFRARLREIFVKVQDADGTWNDRVFPRSRSFGTAMATMALRMNELPSVPRWEANAKKKEGAPPK